MRSFSLRLPYLIYLSIGSMLIGVLIAPVFRDVPPTDVSAAHRTLKHDLEHPVMDVPSLGAPQIAMTVQKDPLGGWNLMLRTENFTFAPTAVNQENTPNTGHAHLHINGSKVARLYGPHFHVPDLPPGQHEISVALSSNDHSFYAVNGDRIEAHAVIMQGPVPILDS